MIEIRRGSTAKSPSHSPSTGIGHSTAQLQLHFPSAEGQSPAIHPSAQGNSGPLLGKTSPSPSPFGEGEVEAADYQAIWRIASSAPASPEGKAEQQSISTAPPPQPRPRRGWDCWGFATQRGRQVQMQKTQADGEAPLVKGHNSAQQDFEEKINFKRAEESLSFSTNFQNSLQKRLQTKIVELAKHYNEESIEAVTNFFADILSFATLWFLLVRLEIQINITKSFLLEVFFGLDDSKKSLLILFLTDLLVGYHSPNIWELFFQTLFDHYGLPESQTTIFLLVATLPVLLDVLFKYLIFRHLNRASPATVATYHAMIE